MRNVKRTSLPLLLMLLGVFACVIPGLPQVDQNAAGTAVQQTLSAIIQQTEDAGKGIVDISSDTPVASATLTLALTETFTPIPPSATASMTPTATLKPPATLTFTPEVPMVSVSVATNCRLGPGKVYQLVGYLTENVWVRVYARDTTHDYWYIRNPANAAQFCWIWGEYATVIGSINNLPNYTPPPTPTPTITSTPTPAFQLSYVSLQTCSAKWWAEVKLKNTGSTTFRSISMTVKDMKTLLVHTAARDDFTGHEGCNSSTRDTLLPGKSTNVSLPVYAYNFKGHKMNATVTLCTQVGMNGYCVTQKLTFWP